MECESEWKTATEVDLFAKRNRFRGVFERFLIEEPVYCCENEIFSKFWKYCYSDILAKFDNNAVLKQYIIDEGIAFLSLLLRAQLPKEARLELLLNLSELKMKRGRSVEAHLQEALSLCSGNERLFELSAKSAHAEKDHFHALYWSLLCLNSCKSIAKEAADVIATDPGTVIYSPRRLQFLKPSKIALLDSTLLFAGPLLQLLSHGVSNQLGSKSHFKHMDICAHSRMPFQYSTLVDFETVLEIVEAILLVVCSSELFPHQQVSLPQCVMLSGLFYYLSCYPQQLGTPLLQLAIPLFSGKNYEIMSKIYPFACEQLHKWLDVIILLDTPSLSLPKHLQSRLKQVKPLLPALIDAELLIEVDGIFKIRPVHEKSFRINRSMKVLAHRLLETKVSALASPIEAAERLSSQPWLLVDYEALMDLWPEIKKNIQENTAKYFISLSLLDQLDVAKNSIAQAREVIRCIHNWVSEGNPSIRLQSAQEASSSLPLKRPVFEEISKTAETSAEGTPFTAKALVRFRCEHLKTIMYLTNQPGEKITIVCHSPLKNLLPEIQK